MLAFTKSPLTPGIAAFGAGMIALGLVIVPPNEGAPTAVHLGSVELIAFLSTGTAANAPTSGTAANPPTSGTAAIAPTSGTAAIAPTGPVQTAAATGTLIDDVIYAIHRVTWPLGYAVAQLGSFLEYAVAGPFLPLLALNIFLNWQSPLIDGIESLLAGWVNFVRGIYDPISAFLGFARGINYEIDPPCTNCTWTVDWDGTVTILSDSQATATPAAARSAARPAAASVKNPAITLATTDDQSAPQPQQSARGAATRAGVEPRSSRSTAARQRTGEKAAETRSAHAHITASTNRRRSASAQPNSVGNPNTESTASAQNTAAR